MNCLFCNTNLESGYDVDYMHMSGYVCRGCNVITEYQNNVLLEIRYYTDYSEIYFAVFVDFKFNRTHIFYRKKLEDTLPTEFPIARLVPPEQITNFCDKLIELKVFL